MYATTPANNVETGPLTVDNIPARIAQPFDIGSKAVTPAIELRPYEGPAMTEATASATSDAAVSLEKTCFSAGSVPASHLKATMLHAGVRLDISNPNQPYGSWQVAGVTADYEAMPSECIPDYKRVGRAQMEIKDHNVWHNMKGGNYWSTTYSRNIVGSGGATWNPSGHEKPSFYWRPGDVVRAKFDTVVKNLRTGKTKISATQIAPVEVHHH